jgi:Tfp pilus assembly protein PilN
MTIDFAAPSWRRALHRTAAGYWLIAAVGLALCLSLVFVSGADSARQSALREEIEDLQTRLAQRKPRAAQRPVQAVPEARVLAINAVVTQLNMPWHEVLDALEAASGSTVAVLEIHTEAKNRWIRGTAEARTTGAMLAYLERLKAQSVLVDARLNKHEINTQDANDPIRFEFEVRWREALP